VIARVGCVVLAAGEGRRFGGVQSKLLAPVDGSPLLQRAIDAAASSQAMSCTLVTGAQALVVLGAVDLRRCSVVDNPGWAEGIASSVRAGLEQHRGDEACIFMVADQPFISSTDLNRLIAEHRAEREAIIALRASDVWGTPMLFPACDFPALARLCGDAGAKRFAQAHQARVRFVSAQSARAFADVDTVDDYERVLGQIEHRS
jgi:molybdenum cofactor cytidylyltransferase